jgi:hypothetical protein
MDIKMFQRFSRVIVQCVTEVISKQFFTCSFFFIFFLTVVRHMFLENMITGVKFTVKNVN